MSSCKRTNQIVTSLHFTTWHLMKDTCSLVCPKICLEPFFQLQIVYFPYMRFSCYEFIGISLKITFKNFNMVLLVSYNIVM